jgi:hypothetical protein
VDGSSKNKSDVKRKYLKRGSKNRTVKNMGYLFPFFFLE